MKVRGALFYSTITIYYAINCKVNMNNYFMKREFVEFYLFLNEIENTYDFF